MEECLDWPLSKVLEIIQKRITQDSTYFGIATQKSPMDLWIYQEIIYQSRPDLIIEIGNLNGGSALALAHMCDVINVGRILGVDINHAPIPPRARAHPRIQFITGDACAVIDQVRQVVQKDEKVMVIEDSSHTYQNTLNVLRTYSEFIPIGGYFIVEDGICRHGLEVGPSPGPFEATEAFIKENDNFKIDRSKEIFCITWNPKGYLTRIK